MRCINFPNSYGSYKELVQNTIIIRPGFFFERLKKTELPKKLSPKKTEAFWKKKLSVPEGFQGHQAEKKLSLHVLEGKKGENITSLVESSPFYVI